MMIKFLGFGKGSGQRASTYLLSLKDHSVKVRAGVTVLRGDPGLVGQVADSLDFRHHYTSGVLAWAPDDKPTSDQIEKVLDSFKKPL